jgi:hypothetical protein
MHVRYRAGLLPLPVRIVFRRRACAVPQRPSALGAVKRQTGIVLGHIGMIAPTAFPLLGRRPGLGPVELYV